VAVAAAAAGAAQRRAFDNLLFAFRQGDATARTRARSLADLGANPTRILTTLQNAGVILPGADLGTFYLDERALHAYRGSQQRRAARLALIVGAVLLLVAAAIAFLTARPTSR
jgi:hypothetical protein